ncbi:hypothetical protein CEXT_122891 [Caerostris extrusa]|uniref:Uncharacterized protein n=1 Tax=Caerostris extrusa TaxID=172846 RepID=A0AAV4QNS4_CAEEX|nr:hypothetical protein CEXT_122891 [Caerostris extrusa]
MSGSGIFGKRQIQLDFPLTNGIIPTTHREPTLHCLKVKPNLFQTPLLPQPRTKADHTLITQLLLDWSCLWRGESNYSNCYFYAYGGFEKTGNENRELLLGLMAQYAVLAVEKFVRHFGGQNDFRGLQTYLFCD